MVLPNPWVQVVSPSCSICAEAPDQTLPATAKRAKFAMPALSAAAIVANAGMAPIRQH